MKTMTYFFKKTMFCLLTCLSFVFCQSVFAQLNYPASGRPISTTQIISSTGLFVVSGTGLGMAVSNSDVLSLGLGNNNLGIYFVSGSSVTRTGSIFSTATTFFLRPTAGTSLVAQNNSGQNIMTVSGNTNGVAFGSGVTPVANLMNIAYTISATAISNTSINAKRDDLTCNAANTGNIRFSSVSATIQFCTGTIWRSLVSATI
jgi:hypothetical protein